MPDSDRPDLRRVFALKSFPGLEGLSLADLALLAQNLYESFTPAGSFIVREGERVDRVHLVIRGRFEFIRHTRAGPVHETVGEHAIHGMIGAFAGTPSRYDVVAAVDTWSYVIYADEIIDLVEDHFSLLVAALRGLGRLVMSQLMALPHMRTPPGCDLSESHLRSEPLGLSERILYLYRQPFGFGAGQIQPVAALVRDAEEIVVPAGTTLWRVGDPADEMIFVLSGRLRATRADGQVFEFRDGAPAGALECLAEQPHWYDTVADGPVRGLKLRPRHMLDVLEDHTDAALQILKSIAFVLEQLLSDAPNADTTLAMPLPFQLMAATALVQQHQRE